MRSDWLGGKKQWEKYLIWYIVCAYGKLNAIWCSKSLEVIELILGGARRCRSGLCFYAQTPSAFGGQHRLGLAGLTIHTCFTNIEHGWKRTTWWWWWLSSSQRIQRHDMLASIISHFTKPSLWLQICYSYNPHATILHNFGTLVWKLVLSENLQRGFRGMLGR